MWPRPSESGETRRARDGGRGGVSGKGLGEGRSVVGAKGQEMARLALRVRTCGETGKSKRRVALLTQCVDYINALTGKTPPRPSQDSPRPCSTVLYVRSTAVRHQTLQPPPASHGTTTVHQGEPIPNYQSQPILPSLLRLHVLRSTVPLTHRHNPLPQPTNHFWVSPTQEMSSSRRYKENDGDRDREREHTRSRTTDRTPSEVEKERYLEKERAERHKERMGERYREPRDSTRTRHRIESDSEGIANVDRPSAHR